MVRVRIIKDIIEFLQDHAGNDNIFPTVLQLNVQLNAQMVEMFFIIRFANKRPCESVLWVSHESNYQTIYSLTLKFTISNLPNKIKIINF